MSSETLRPGVARGFYPEREDPSESWLDRTVRTISGAVDRRRQAARPRLEAFARSVETQASGLREESDAGLAPLLMATSPFQKPWVDMDLDLEVE